MLNTGDSVTGNYYFDANVAINGDVNYATDAFVVKSGAGGGLNQVNYTGNGVNGTLHIWDNTNFANALQVGVLAGSSAFASAGSIGFSSSTDSTGAAISFTVSAGGMLFNANTGGKEIAFNTPTVAVSADLGVGGDLTFTSDTASFMPRRISQTTQPANGTGSTQIDVGEQAIWRDSDDNQVWLMYNDTDEGILKVQLQ